MLGLHPSQVRVQSARSRRKRHEMKGLWVKRAGRIVVLLLMGSLVGLLLAGCSSTQQTASRATSTTSATTGSSLLFGRTSEPNDRTPSSTSSTTAVTPHTTPSSTTTTVGLGLFPARGPRNEDWVWLWGYIDREGHYVIAPQFRKAYVFSDGLAAVQRLDQTYGYIDANGEFLPQIEVISGFAPRFTEGLAPARADGGKVGFIDKQGNWVISPRFDSACPYTEGLAAVEIDGRWGYVDRTGSFVIPPRFLRAYWFSEGLAAAAIEVPGSGQEPAQTKWGYIDKTGQFIIVPQFLYANLNRYRCSPGDFHEGLADIVVEGYKRCFIDRAGRIVLGPYLDAFGFSEGLAPVLTQEGGKWGYIDKAGEFVIPPQFENAFPFEDGLARVVIPPGSNGYIDTTGRVVWSSP